MEDHGAIRISLEDALEVLGLNSPNVQIKPDQVRPHCKRLLLKYHPDKPGGNRQKFEVIHAASKVVLKALQQKSNHHVEFKSAAKMAMETWDEPATAVPRTVYPPDRQVPPPSRAASPRRAVSKEKFSQAWETAEKSGIIARRRGYGKLEEDFSAENSGKQIIVRIEPDPIWDGIDDIVFDAPTLSGAGDDELTSKPAVAISQTAGCDYHTAYAVDRSIDRIRSTREEMTAKDLSKYEQMRDRHSAADYSELEKQKIANHAKYIERMERERINRQAAADKERERVYNMMNNLLT